MPSANNGKLHASGTLRNGSPAMAHGQATLVDEPPAKEPRKWPKGVAMPSHMLAERIFRKLVKSVCEDNPALFKRIDGKTKETLGTNEDAILYHLSRLQTQLHLLVVGSEEASKAVATVVQAMSAADVQLILKILDWMENYPLSDFIRLMAQSGGVQRAVSQARAVLDHHAIRDPAEIRSVTSYSRTRAEPDAVARSDPGGGAGAGAGHLRLNLNSHAATSSEDAHTQASRSARLARPGPLAASSVNSPTGTSSRPDPLSASMGPHGRGGNAFLKPMPSLGERKLKGEGGLGAVSWNGPLSDLAATTGKIPPRTLSSESVLMSSSHDADGSTSANLPISPTGLSASVGNVGPSPPGAVRMPARFDELQQRSRDIHRRALATMERIAAVKIDPLSEIMPTEYDRRVTLSLRPPKNSTPRETGPGGVSLSLGPKTLTSESLEPWKAKHPTDSLVFVAPPEKAKADVGPLMKQAMAVARNRELAASASQADLRKVMSGRFTSPRTPSVGMPAGGSFVASASIGASPSDPRPTDAAALMANADGVGGGAGSPPAVTSPGGLGSPGTPSSITNSGVGSPGSPPHRAGGPGVGSPLGNGEGSPQSAHLSVGSPSRSVSNKGASPGGGPDSTRRSSRGAEDRAQDAGGAPALDKDGGKESEKTSRRGPKAGAYHLPLAEHLGVDPSGGTAASTRRSSNSQQPSASRESAGGETSTGYQPSQKRGEPLNLSWMQRTPRPSYDGSGDGSSSYRATPRHLLVPQYLEMCAQLRIPRCSAVVRQIGLSHMELQHCGLGLDGVKALVAAFPLVSKLRYLGLGDNGLDSVAVEALLVGLEENPHIPLGELDLSNNRVGRAGAEALAAYLDDSRVVSTNSQGPRSCPLEHLQLSACELPDNACWAILAAVSNNRRLKALNLAHNSAGMRSGQQLETVLSENSSLLSLDVSWNNLRVPEAIRLARGLKENEYLQMLNMEWNGFGSEGAIQLAASVQGHASLIYINLSHCEIGTEACPALAQALAENLVLEVVQLSNNPIGLKGLEMLIAAVGGDGDKTKMCALDITGCSSNTDVKTGQRPGSQGRADGAGTPTPGSAPGGAAATSASTSKAGNAGPGGANEGAGARAGASSSSGVARLGALSPATVALLSQKPTAPVSEDVFQAYLAQLASDALSDRERLDMFRALMRWVRVCKHRGVLGAIYARICKVVLTCSAHS
eukprot:jgi/Mesvir1/12080/Mv00359-RA.3